MFDSPIRLSQGHLQLLELCPPQFQRRYLEQKYETPNPQQQKNLDWGDRFHRLMQQWQLGLPLDNILNQNPEFAQSLQALIQTVPALQSDTVEREAEHYRILPFQDYVLTVIYDLLVIDPERAEILDWKTYPLPQKVEKIRNHWQTRLYLYVLAETTAYQPEQLSMTYWFVKLPKQPESLTISYSQSQHQTTQESLNLLLNQLTQWLSLQNALFPHRTNCTSICPYSANFQAKNNLTENKTDWLKYFQQA
ncbi:MAG: PD-(D/E)XK nuclease family protein [Microcystaceae cyanobacterium]